MPDMPFEEWKAWVMRVFGSWEAYYAALPNRSWLRSPFGGWFSIERGDKR